MLIANANGYIESSESSTRNVLLPLMLCHSSRLALHELPPHSRLGLGR